jgi:hypothetical protein
MAGLSGPLLSGQQAAGVPLADPCRFGQLGHGHVRVRCPRCGEPGRCGRPLRGPARCPAAGRQSRAPSRPARTRVPTKAWHGKPPGLVCSDRGFDLPVCPWCARQSQTRPVSGGDSDTIRHVDHASDQPKRHRVTFPVTVRHEAKATLNPRVQGSSPWRRTLHTINDLSVP